MPPRTSELHADRWNATALGHQRSGMGRDGVNKGWCQGIQHLGAVHNSYEGGGWWVAGRNWQSDVIPVGESTSGGSEWAK